MTAIRWCFWATVSPPPEATVRSSKTIRSCVTRNRRVRFINAGWGGDTAAGGAARLERDVLGCGATLVTVACGVNDIGWSGKADDEHKQKYLDGVRDIVTQCKNRGVRVFICSVAITGADPEKSENDYLQRMCDEGMALSQSLGGGATDVQRSMREIQKRIWAANREAKDDKDKHTVHAADGVHLNDLGQLAMGFAILKKGPWGPGGGLLCDDRCDRGASCRSLWLQGSGAERHRGDSGV